MTSVRHVVGKADVGNSLLDVSPIWKELSGARQVLVSVAAIVLPKLGQRELKISLSELRVFLNRLSEIERRIVIFTLREELVALAQIMACAARAAHADKRENRGGADCGLAGSIHIHLLPSP